MSKRTSLAKIEANRVNALLSSGPKTPEGKERVKRNALKHGILSKEVVITAGDGAESREEFDELLQSFVEELNPVGAVEAMLVEKIAVCYWRLRRVLRAEVGQIRQRTDTFYYRREIQQAQELEVEDAGLFGVSVKGYERLTRNSVGIKRLLGALTDAAGDIKRKGFIDENALLEVAESFEGSGLEVELEFLNQCITEECRERIAEEWGYEGELPSPDRCRKEMLRLIASKKRELKRMLQEAQAREKLEAQSALASFSIPSEDVIDKLLRYETVIERSLYRAIHELQRLQSARMGQSVAAPAVLDIDVSQIPTDWVCFAVFVSSFDGMCR